MRPRRIIFKRGYVPAEADRILRFVHQRYRASMMASTSTTLGTSEWRFYYDA